MKKRLLQETIKKCLPPKLLNILIDRVYVRKLEKHGLSIRKCDYFFDILDNSNRCVRISRKHNVYIQDILRTYLKNGTCTLI